MVKQIFTKKDKRELYKKILPFISKKLQSMSDDYTYKEIGDLCGANHVRVIEAANGAYLNENTLRLFLGGEVIHLQELKDNVDLSTKDAMYLDQLSATSNPALVRKLVRLIDKIGFDNTLAKLDTLLREKH